MSIGTPKQIRADVIAALLNATDADARVRDSEPLPLDLKSLSVGPWLSVWTPKRHSVPMAGYRKHRVSLDIAVQGVLSGPDSPTIAERIDDLESQIRDVLLSGTWAQQWATVESVEFNGGIDPDRPGVGSFDLTIRVTHNQQYTPAAPTATGQVHQIETDPANTGAPTTEQTIVVTAPPAP